MFVHVPFGVGPGLVAPAATSSLFLVGTAENAVQLKNYIGTLFLKEMYQNSGTCRKNSRETMISIINYDFQSLSFLDHPVQ